MPIPNFVLINQFRHNKNNNNNNNNNKYINESDSTSEGGSVSGLRILWTEFGSRLNLKAASPVMSLARAYKTDRNG